MHFSVLSVITGTILASVAAAAPVAPVIASHEKRIGDDHWGVPGEAFDKREPEPEAHEKRIGDDRWGVPGEAFDKREPEPGAHEMRYFQTPDWNGEVGEAFDKRENDA
ncbi:hypothetical protein V8E54_003274 [Elaphomyces granulatus]